MTSSHSFLRSFLRDLFACTRWFLRGLSACSLLRELFAFTRWVLSGLSAFLRGFVFAFLCWLVHDLVTRYWLVFVGLSPAVLRADPGHELAVLLAGQSLNFSFDWFQGAVGGAVLMIVTRFRYDDFL